MTDIIRIVTQKLESYLYLQRCLKLLGFELEHRAKITPEEMLESMAYPQQSDGTSVMRSGHTDKTMDVAVGYRSACKRTNKDIFNEIKREHYLTTLEVERMEFYVTFLSEELGAIIRHHYFEGKPWKELQLQMNVSERTLNRRRKEAIAEIAELYRMAGVLDAPEQ